MRSIIDSHGFLELSALLNYQLSGSPIDWRVILAQIVKKHRTDDDLLFEALIYLRDVYGQKRRKIGPLMILHPIRVATLLAKTQGEPSTLNILAALFHDLREDMDEGDYSISEREILERKYNLLQEKLDSKSRWLLEERIYFLTKAKEQGYRQYLEGLLSYSLKTPELILIKLIDRLDNTYDMRLDITDEAEKANFYTIIFDAIFTKSYKGLSFTTPHHITSKINGAMRLFQLYKNIMFLTLIRTNKLKLEDTANMLFESLIMASSKEAQNIILHIFAYHLCAPDEQKALLHDILAFILGKKGEQPVVHDLNKIGAVFNDCLNHTDKTVLDTQINNLYENKRLMCQTALIFLIIFSNFLNDPAFSIKEDFRLLETGV